MAELVQKEIGEVRSIDASIGKQLLDVITSGMYNNPFMVLREYIQNAADSIDEASENGIHASNSDESCIGIMVSGKNREIIVLDNGTGVSNTQAEVRIGSMGFSKKDNSRQRGFRGIGRLGGLAYCDKLVFETRSHQQERIAVVEWDNQKLQSIAGSYCLKDTIQKIATIKFRSPNPSDLDHFFKVTMVNVHRFHGDELMNIKKIGAYLSQVAPVPFDRSKFSFGYEIDDFLSQIQNYRTYSIFLNGQKLCKPYSSTFNISEVKQDEIRAIKKLTFTNPDTNAIIGLGWFAITSFKSSLPKPLNIRGIRVRHGNIEVGNERFLDSIYTESRFSIWQIGEIHLNHTIKPNARRDGFEQNECYERFLERATMVGKGLSKLCRDSSVRRSQKQKTMGLIEEIQNTIYLQNLILDEEHWTSVSKLLQERFETAYRLIAANNLGSSALHRLSALKKQVQDIKGLSFLRTRLDGRKLKGFSKVELLEKICKEIMANYAKDRPIEHTLEKALLPYFKLSIPKPFQRKPA